MPRPPRSHSVSQLATQVAEKILANPDKDADSTPEVIAALESVIGQLERSGGADLKATLELAKAAVERAKGK